MASIMAIISKGVFETLVKEHHGAALGSCIPLDKYLSANKALASLADGGSLFLVTVRPPNESLWLVAILESPEFKTDHWESSKNAIPITDITNLMGKLTFENGNGITAKPGLLGASLQSPRRLVDSDINLLRDAAGSKGVKKDVKQKTETLSSGTAPSISEKTVTNKASSKKSDTNGLTSLQKSKNVVGKHTPLPQDSVPTDVTVEYALSSPSNWTSLDDTTRQRVLQEIVERLDNNYTVDNVREGREGLGCLIHKKTGAKMMVIPGGNMAMGLSIDDFYQIVRIVPVSERDELTSPHNTRPVHPVAMKPFLISKKCADLKQLFGSETVDVSKISTMVKKLSFRLQSEAEWEWIAREGGTRIITSSKYKSSMPPGHRKLETDFKENGWGIEGLIHDAGELCEDTWSENYLKALSTSEPLSDPSSSIHITRYVHTSFQDSFEVLGQHASETRYTLRDTARYLRLVADIPGTTFTKPDDTWCEKTVAYTMEAIAGTSQKEHTAAFWAIRELANDTLTNKEIDTLLDKLFPLLDTLSEDALALALQIIATCLTGGINKWTRNICGFSDTEIFNTKIIATRISHYVDYIDTLKRYLTNTNAQIRIAASVCAAVANAKKELTTALTKETDPIAKASLMIALGHCGDSSLCNQYLQDENKLIASMSGIAMILANRGACKNLDCYKAMALALSLSEMKESQWPWFGDDLSGFVIELLKSGSEEARLIGALSLIDSSLKQREYCYKIVVFGQSFQLLFDRSLEILTADSLTKAQRTFLELISDPKQKITKIRIENSLFFGIPEDITTRRIWLGLAPPTVLDTIVETMWNGKQKKWTLWEWFYAVRRLVKKRWESDDEENAWEKINKQFIDYFNKLDPLFKIDLLIDLCLRDDFYYEFYYIFDCEKLWKEAVKKSKPQALAMIDKIKAIKCTPKKKLHYKLAALLEVAGK